MNERMWGGRMAGATAAFQVRTCRRSIAVFRIAARRTKLLTVERDIPSNPGVFFSDSNSNSSVDMVIQSTERASTDARWPVPIWTVSGQTPARSRIAADTRLALARARSPVPPGGQGEGEVSHLRMPSLACSAWCVSSRSNTQNATGRPDGLCHDRKLTPVDVISWSASRLKNTTPFTHAPENVEVMPRRLHVRHDIFCSKEPNQTDTSPHRRYIFVIATAFRKS